MKKSFKPLLILQAFLLLSFAYGQSATAFKNSLSEDIDDNYWAGEVTYTNRWLETDKNNSQLCYMSIEKLRDGLIIEAGSNVVGSDNETRLRIGTLEVENDEIVYEGRVEIDFDGDSIITKKYHLGGNLDFSITSTKKLYLYVHHELGIVRADMNYMVHKVRCEFTEDF